MVDINLEDAFNFGIEAHSAGNITDAESFYTSILKVLPDHPATNHNMGILHVGIGKHRESLSFFKKAIENDPLVEQFWVSYLGALINLGQLSDAEILINQTKSKGFSGEKIKRLEELLASKNNVPKRIPSQEIINQLLSLYNQGQLVEAADQGQALVEQYPEAFVLWNILGAANNSLGRIEEASKAFKKVTELNPNYPDGFNNLGVTLQELGELQEAKEVLNKALSIKPDYAEAHYNMGKVLKDQGNFEGSIGSSQKALSINPNYAEAHFTLGKVHQNQGFLEEAIKAYKKALSLKPDYPEAHLNIGNIFSYQGKLDNSLEEYKKVILLNPYHANAWVNAAEALEQHNKLELLEVWLEKAFRVFDVVPSDIKVLKSKLFWRTNNKKEASKIIFNININTLSEIRKQDYLQLKAKCFEYYKDFGKAFECFIEMNSIAKISNEYKKCNTDEYFKNLKNELAFLKAKPSLTTSLLKAQKLKLNPVFLVGFPRSGTTLLDTILRSHSQIKVVEEQPSFILAQNYIHKNTRNDTMRKDNPKDFLHEARKIYESEFKIHIGNVSANKTYVDKYPLNLLNAHLIQKLYPETKFILALRHPMDTILSCWMQNFQLNDAMANMTDLDRTVEFYCVAMETFMVSCDKYNLSIHKIRYEDLLEDLNHETSKLLNFLDLKWENKMQNYRQTALKRNKINTPSYSQVIQPIYKDAKFRWINYEKYLSKYLKQLDPWIKEFGYN